MKYYGSEYGLQMLAYRVFMDAFMNMDVDYMTAHAEDWNIEPERIISLMKSIEERCAIYERYKQHEQRKTKHVSKARSLQKLQKGR